MKKESVGIVLLLCCLTMHGMELSKKQNKIDKFNLYAGSDGTPVEVKRKILKNAITLKNLVADLPTATDIYLPEVSQENLNCLISYLPVIDNYDNQIFDYQKKNIKREMVSEIQKLMPNPCMALIKTADCFEVPLLLKMGISAFVKKHGQKLLSNNKSTQKQYITTWYKQLDPLVAHYMVKQYHENLQKIIDTKNKLFHIKSLDNKVTNVRAIIFFPESIGIGMGTTGDHKLAFGTSGQFDNFFQKVFKKFQMTGASLQNSLHDKKLIVSYKDGGVQVLNIEDWHVGQKPQSLAYLENIHPYFIDFLSDNSIIFGHSKQITCYDLQEKTFKPILSDYTASIKNAILSPDKSKIMIFSPQGEAKILNITSEECLATLQHVTTAAFSPDGNKVACNITHEGITVIDIKTGARSKFFYKPFLKGVVSMTFSPQGTHLVVGYGDGTILLLKIGTRKSFILRHIDDAKNFSRKNVLKLAFSPDGTQLVAAGWDIIQVWNFDNDLNDILNNTITLKRAIELIKKAPVDFLTRLAMWFN